MLTHERNKNPRTKRGCLMCYQLGTAGQPYGYIDLELMPMFVKPGEPAMKVTKEVGLCFKHVREMCDTKVGPWMKSGFGLVPQRDGKFVLRTEEKIVERQSHSYRSPAPGSQVFLRVPKWW